MDLETCMDLDKLRKRDAEALNIWIHRNYDDIYRLLRHLTRHVETAEDLAQQTFLKACPSPCKFRDPSFSMSIESIRVRKVE